MLAKQGAPKHVLTYVMPLVGLNRALVAQGLKVMARREHAGIAALLIGLALAIASLREGEKFTVPHLSASRL